LWKTLDVMSSIKKDIVNSIDWFIETPMRAGLLLTLAISFPFSDTDIECIRADMVTKELVAMERPRRPSSIDWLSILQGDEQYQIGFRPHPSVTRQSFVKVRVWAEKLSAQILFPHSGTKLLSRSSHDCLKGITGSTQSVFSSSDAERIYGQTGERPDSSCEMKSRWYATQVVPRVYFAQGLTAYHSSKYLRDPFNKLADYFRNVNRHSRVLPQLVQSEHPDDDLYIYDLTSFTSLFHEHREFLLALAEVTDQVEIVYADAWFGKSYTTLGSLIREYVLHNVSDPTYCSLLLPIEQSLELSHGTAGFLGVYGNLITCTIPHGITLATFNDDFRTCWCAGDDAGICTECKRKQELFQLLQRIGDIAVEKTFVGSEVGSVALKRPIMFSQGLVVFSNNVVWPVLGLLYGNSQYLPSDIEKGKDKFASAFVSFIFSALKVDMSSEDKDLALRIVSFVYRSLGFPTTGWYPPCTGKHPHTVTLPILDSLTFETDPLERLVRTFCRGTYVCSLKEEAEVDKEELMHQRSSVGNMTQCLKWMSVLGLVYAEEVRVELYGDEAVERALDDARLRSSRQESAPVVYTFTLLREIPTAVLTVF